MLTDIHKRLHNGLVSAGSWSTVYTSPSDSSIIISSIFMRTKNPGDVVLVDILLNNKAIYKSFSVENQNIILSDLGIVMEASDTLEIKKLSSQQEVHFSIFGVQTKTNVKLVQKTLNTSHEDAYSAPIASDEILSSINLTNTSTTSTTVDLSISDNKISMGPYLLGIGSQGDAGKLFKSTNGLSWTTVYTFPSQLSSVAAGKGVILAASQGSLYASSDDGVSWTVVLSNIGSVAYANEKFVALGNTYSSSMPVATSVDGYTWSISVASLPWVYSVMSANNFFIANKTYGIYYSSDGVTWTQNDFADRDIVSVSYGGGKFLATTIGSGGSGSGTNRMYHSDNLINWTQSTLPSVVNNNFFDASFIGSNYVIITGGFDVLYSSDLISWTVIQAIGANTYSLDKINGTLFAIGISYPGKVYYTTDGVIWTEYTTNRFISKSLLVDLPANSDPDEYIMKSFEIMPLETVSLKAGYTISSNQVLRASASQLNSIELNIFGAEV